MILHQQDADMSKIIKVTIVAIVVGLLTLNSVGCDAHDSWEIANMIQSDKFDIVLPKSDGDEKYRKNSQSAALADER